MKKYIQITAAVIGVIIFCGLIYLSPVLVIGFSAEKYEKERANYLKILTPEKEAEAEQVYINPENNKKACIFLQGGAMSFSSPNRILCIYDNNGKILDKSRFGCHSLIISNWNNGEIELTINLQKTGDKERDEHEEQYIRSWIDRNKVIDKNKIIYNLVSP